MAVSMLTRACWGRLLGSIPGFRAVPARFVTMVGVRDVDPPEAQLLAYSGIAVLPPGDVGEIARATEIRGIALTAYDPSVDPDGAVVAAAEAVLERVIR